MPDDATAAGRAPASAAADVEETKPERLRRSRAVLHAARGHLTKRALHLIGFVVFAILIMEAIPGLESALESLKNVSLQWVIGAMAVETLSEIGYVVSWRGILDPDHLLRQGAAASTWVHASPGRSSGAG